MTWGLAVNSHQKHKWWKGKKLHLIKLKNFCALKIPSRKWKDKLTEWKEIFANHIQVSSLCPSIKVSFMPLCFYEITTSLPIFANGKKSKEDFHFYGERGKAKINVYHLFCSKPLESAAPQAVSGRAKLLPRNHTPSRHQDSRALNCVCEHVCSILTHFVHPLARHVLRFHRNSLLLDSRGYLYLIRT